MNYQMDNNLDSQLPNSPDRRNNRNEMNDINGGDLYNLNNMNRQNNNRMNQKQFQQYQQHPNSPEKEYFVDQDSPSYKSPDIPRRMNQNQFENNKMQQQEEDSFDYYANQKPKSNLNNQPSRQKMPPSPEIQEGEEEIAEYDQDPIEEEPATQESSGASFQSFNHDESPQKPEQQNQNQISNQSQKAKNLQATPKQQKLKANPPETPEIAEYPESSDVSDSWQEVKKAPPQVSAINIDVDEENNDGKDSEAVDEEAAQAIEEEEEEIADEAIPLAERFRILSGGLADRYLITENSAIPHITKDSRIYVNFKACKFDKIRKALEGMEKRDNFGQSPPPIPEANESIDES
ncbi:hypothetical protein TRFO_18517 [Tritrichomonas foetus]|uniref:Uncharacterized protein n=1 Tax=Tritrichomonas foetus TaxID=1144522 RepID=A0A1J4KKK6_9EUKA|nr:hypothetical protein TRFO_18517 [Tritrichomonas foetus]|eukprot:OHT11841.1 hypothetical protein TRFO_18517 [Tritrichomonas foetus]